MCRAEESDSTLARLYIDPAAFVIGSLEVEPFVWARLSGSTLTVYGMFVTYSGGHDRQIFERTPTEEGMQLRFQPLRDDSPYRVVTGTLTRVR